MKCDCSDAVEAENERLTNSNVTDPNMSIFSLCVQYDDSATTFSPEGRIFQIDYAGKAVENSGYEGCNF